MQKLLTLLFLISLQTAVAQSFKVVGYLPYYRFGLINDIEFNRLTHVNIAFANPDSLGNLSVSGTSITSAVNKAHQQGCEVFISLAGGYLTPEWNTNWNNLAQPANRPAFIQKIVQYVQSHNLDGVDIDLEWQYVQDWYSPFILDLKAALEPLNIPLTVALPGSYRYPEITPQALAAFDWVNMMVYDLTGPWDPSNPGQHSPYTWAQQCIQYWQNQGVPAEQLTLGVPFYGYDFGVSPVNAFKYGTIVAADPANAYLDQTGQKFWNGIPTIQAKTELALNEIAGIMIWELGEDAFGDDADLSLLKAIGEVIDAAASGTSENEDLELKIYPNPAQERLFVQLPGAGYYRCVVCDAQGRPVRQLSGNENFDMSIGEFPAGIYTLAVYSDSGIRTGRFVKL